MFRGGLASGLLLVLAVLLPHASVHAFFHTPPAVRPPQQSARVAMSASQQEDDTPGKTQQGLTWSKGLGALGRSFAATSVLLSTVLGGASMQGGGAAAWAAPAPTGRSAAAKKPTAQKQVRASLLAIGK